MNASSFRNLALASTLTTSLLNAPAAPLNRSDAPAEPAWVLHLDCDRLRPTAVGQHILTEMEKPEAKDKLAAFESIFNFNLRTQLHGLTLYDTSKNPEDGVLIVYADFDPARLVVLAKAAEDYHSSPYKQHTIHNWVDEKKKHHKNGAKPRVYAAIQGGRVIFAQREEQVAQALDVIDGSVPTLGASSLFPELGATGDMSYLEAAGRQFNLDSSDPNAAIFRLSQRVTLQMSEAAGQEQGLLTLEANDEEVATQVAAIARGVGALLKLQKEKPEVVRFVRALSLQQEGPKVVINLNMPAGDFIEVLKAHNARKHAKKEN